MTRKRKFDAEEDKEEGGTDSEVPSSQETEGPGEQEGESGLSRLRRTGRACGGASSLRESV